MNGKHNALDRILERLSLKYDESAAKVAKALGIQPSKLSRIRNSPTEKQYFLIESIVEAYPGVKEYADQVVKEATQVNEAAPKYTGPVDPKLLEAKDEIIELERKIKELELNNLKLISKISKEDLARNAKLQKVLLELEELNRREQKLNIDKIKLLLKNL